MGAIASTTARPAQRSARALRSANATPSGMAVAAYGREPAVSDRLHLRSTRVRTRASVISISARHPEGRDACVRPRAIVPAPLLNPRTSGRLGPPQPDCCKDDEQARTAASSRPHRWTHRYRRRSRTAAAIRWLCGVAAPGLVERERVDPLRQHDSTGRSSAASPARRGAAQPVRHLDHVRGRPCRYIP